MRQAGPILKSLALELRYRLEALDNRAFLDAFLSPSTVFCYRQQLKSTVSSLHLFRASFSYLRNILSYESVSSQFFGRM